MSNIYLFLDQLGIAYQRFDHLPVYTTEQANLLSPPTPGAGTKNLFLRDKRALRHFLVVVSDHKQLDLKLLAAQLGLAKLSLASSERLQDCLGIHAGAVSLLALVNDETRHVELLIDRDLWKAEALQCHPLLNTSTLVISRADLEKFFRATGHIFTLISIPERA